MIPKIIHFCWYGTNPKPAIVLKCINTWKSLHPDYEIIEWNEYNSPKHEIITSNLKKKIWAYASDYTRLYALYNFGGFYLDTDFYLIKSLENLRTNKCILAFESPEWVTNGFAASAIGHEFFNKCLKEIEQVGHTKQKPYIAPHLTTNILKTYQNPIVYKDQNIGDIRILLAPSFYHYSYWEVRNNSLDRLIDRCPSSSYGIHLYMHSWKDSSINYNKFQRLTLLCATLLQKFKLTFLNN